MEIFRNTKNSKTSSIESDLSIWSEKELRWIAECLSSKNARLEFEITGLQHVIGFQGEEYKHALKTIRSERKSYEEMPLVFDGPPQTEHSIRYKVPELKLMGLMRYPKAKLECDISVGNLEKIKEGNLGSLSIQRMASLEPAAGYYLVSAEFFVQTENQQAEIFQTLQAALVADGTATLNFQLEPIQSGDSWVSKLKCDNYTPSSVIKSAFVHSYIGRGARPQLL